MRISLSNDISLNFLEVVPEFRYLRVLDSEVFYTTGLISALAIIESHLAIIRFKLY